MKKRPLILPAGDDLWIFVVVVGLAVLIITTVLYATGGGS